jgi:hypothetical protein
MDCRTWVQTTPEMFLKTGILFLVANIVTKELAM